MSNLLDSIRKFILTCPFLQDGRVNVDYIGEEMGYSIDPLPCDPIVQRYIDGGAKKQFQFAFTSQEEYDQDARINIENSGFFQDFDDNGPMSKYQVLILHIDFLHIFQLKSH